MGCIIIKKTNIDRLTIDNAFSTLAVVNNLTKEVRSISVDDLYRYIKEAGASGFDSSIPGPLKRKRES